MLSLLPHRWTGETNESSASMVVGNRHGCSTWVQESTIKPMREPWELSGTFESSLGQPLGGWENLCRRPFLLSLLLMQSLRSKPSSSPF
jgi:hypothetical protein